MDQLTREVPDVGGGERGVKFDEHRVIRIVACPGAFVGIHDVKKLLFFFSTVGDSGGAFFFHVMYISHMLVVVYILFICFPSFPFMRYNVYHVYSVAIRGKVPGGRWRRVAGASPP